MMPRRPPLLRHLLLLRRGVTRAAWLLVCGARAKMCTGGRRSACWSLRGRRRLVKEGLGQGARVVCVCSFGADGSTQLRRERGRVGDWAASFERPTGRAPTGERRCPRGRIKSLDSRHACTSTRCCPHFRTTTTTHRQRTAPPPPPVIDAPTLHTHASSDTHRLVVSIPPVPLALARARAFAFPVRTRARRLWSRARAGALAVARGP